MSIRLVTDDVDTEYERIRQSTAELVIAPTTMAWGTALAWWLTARDGITGAPALAARKPTRA